MSPFLDNVCSIVKSSAKGSEVTHMDYKKELISIINSIQDDGQLEYLYTFLLWLFRNWGY